MSLSLAAGTQELISHQRAHGIQKRTWLRDSDMKIYYTLSLLVLAPIAWTEIRPLVFKFS